MQIRFESVHCDDMEQVTRKQGSEIIPVKCRGVLLKTINWDKVARRRQKALEDSINGGRTHAGQEDQAAG